MSGHGPHDEPVPDPTKTPPFEKGDYRVMRNCCLSGNCFRCRDASPYGTPLRIKQAGGYSKRYAEWVAANWTSYKAAAEKEPT